jgi:hypothetical protein
MFQTVVIIWKNNLVRIYNGFSTWTMWHWIVGRLVNDQLNNSEGSSCSSSKISLEGLRKILNLLRVAGIPAQIHTKPLSTTSQENCSCSNLQDQIWSAILKKNTITEILKWAETTIITGWKMDIFLIQDFSFILSKCELSNELWHYIINIYNLNNEWN